MSITEKLEQMLKLSMRLVKNDGERMKQGREKDNLNLYLKSCSLSCLNWINLVIITVCCVFFSQIQCNFCITKLYSTKSNI